MIPIRVEIDLFKGLSRLFGNDPIDAFPGLEDFLGLDFNVGGVSTEATKWLMDEESCVRQGISMFLIRSDVDVRCDTTDPTGSNGTHDRLDKPYRIKDGVTGFDVPSGRTDKKRYRIISLVRQRKKFFDSVPGLFVVYLAEEGDRPFLE